MYRRIPIKNHVEEIQLVTHRAIAVLVFMCILVLLLIARLAYLQFHQHDLYTTLSQKNWLDLVPIEPTRGLIYDRNGVLLAENIPVFSLDVIPNKIDNMVQMLSDIAKIIPLTDTEIAQFQKQLKQHRRFDEIPLKMRLSDEEVAIFSENQYRFPGLLIKARLLRHYPLGNSLVHMLGYVGRINTQELNEIDAANYSASNYIGKLGIEKFYEDELHGTVGYEQAENDASGEPVRTLSKIKPVAGENLYLTIDTKLQIAAEKALAGQRGAIIVIQPKTGEVLALVSQPTYDPNLFVSGISSQDYKALQESPDRPLYNRALRGLYPPASTVKPYIALEGLNAGVTDPRFTLFDPGWYQLRNSTHIFHDWKRHGHGNVNLLRAITGSCDTYFFDLAYKLGIQNIDNILSQFGYGQLTGIDLEEELPGNVPSPAWKRRVKGVGWYPGDTLNSGIGQGSMQVTPLQLANAIATMANRGRRLAPHLLQAEQEPNQSKLIKTPQLKNLIELKDKNYWNIVINAMQNVIQSPEGTGYRRFGHNTPYDVAGKTGTAQVFTKKHYDMTVAHDNQDILPEHLRDNSLFVAFAPVENPKIAIAVVVENSLTAAAIARQVMDYYLVGPPTIIPLAPTAQPPEKSISATPTADSTEDDFNDVH